MKMKITGAVLTVMAPLLFHACGSESAQGDAGVDGSDADDDFRIEARDTGDGTEPAGDTGFDGPEDHPELVDVVHDDVSDDVEGPPGNRFGIGLVGPGNTAQRDLARNLTGDGGYIKPIFPGVDLNLTAVPPEWIDAVRESYDRNLMVVVRVNPPWGQMNVRNMSDGNSFTSYVQLAQKYRMVAEAVLPHVKPDWPIYIEVHNEPNLCYEWTCQPNEAPPHADTPAGWIHYSDTAREYAFFLRDVADELHAVGDRRLKVVNAGLAPGGAVTCECGGSGFTAGVTAIEFMAEMEHAVPGIWDMIDAWATHSYPSSGVGYGFWDSYENCGPGLHFFERELSQIGRDIAVLITETGWTIEHESFHWSREQVADFTVRAYNEVWLDHPSIQAVMPFILQDDYWNNFAWVDSGGNPYPVYDAVRSLRCSLGILPPCG
jgi:hypothetical protein